MAFFTISKALAIQALLGENVLGAPAASSSDNTGSFLAPAAAPQQRSFQLPTCMTDCWNSQCVQGCLASMMGREAAETRVLDTQEYRTSGQKRVQVGLSPLLNINTETPDEKVMNELNPELERNKLALNFVDRIRTGLLGTNQQMEEAVMALDGMTKDVSIFFGPFLFEEPKESVTCLVVKENLPDSDLLSMQRAGIQFSKLSKFPGMKIVRMDQEFFVKNAQGKDTSFATHNLFFKDREANMAAVMKLVDTKGFQKNFLPLVTYKGSGLMIKFHLPQPELPAGVDNPQYDAQSGSKPVWTVGSGEKSNEYLKWGLLGNDKKIIALPFNPMSFNKGMLQKEAYDQAGRDEKFGEWMYIKNRDMDAAHFRLRDADDFKQYVADDAQEEEDVVVVDPMEVDGQPSNP